MKIDLFGGTGFIGSNFAKLYSNETYVHPREDDLAIHKEALYMISTVHNYNVFDDIYKDVNTNIIKTLKVLSNCKGKDFVFNYVSTWFVYGETDSPANENSPCNPKGFYSITKKCAEDLVISYCKTFNIPYRILRLCNVYGPSDKDFSKKKNALQYLIDEIKQNKDINLYYDGEFVRDYMHVDDICRAIHLCLSKADHNQIINIGSGIPQNFKELINFAINETGSSSKVGNMEAADFHKLVQVKDMCMDVSKLKNLGFNQNISIFEGIKKIIQS
jgi:nucleoside-diphosphate-sugar epimerase